MITWNWKKNNDNKLNKVLTGAVILLIIYILMIKYMAPFFIYDNSDNDICHNNGTNQLGHK